jgi:hypothetical protein
MGRRRKQQARPKKLSYELIPQHSDVGQPIHALVSELVDAHHEGLRDARIAIAWALAWKPDQDGYIVCAKISRPSDLDRELAPYDLVLQINREWYYRPSTTVFLRRVKLDTALVSVTCRYGGDGAPVHDERLRPLYRGVRPDVQEYKVILERYGIYSSEIERLEMAMQRAKYGRVPGEWIAATRLQAQLKTINLDVPVEAINAWTQNERYEIAQWVQVRADIGDAPPEITNAIPEPKRITEWRASTTLPFQADAPNEPAREPVAH